MKYKIGDKVRVREDLEVGKSYDGCYFESSMAKLKGKVVEIVDLDGDHYSIKGDKYYWTDEMFSGIAEEEPRNLIPQIAKMLGVEIGERFSLKEYPENYYILDVEMGLCEIIGDSKYSRNFFWGEIIVGKYTIKKLPQKPKLTEAEKIILENLPKEYKWIARDYCGTLYVYGNKPKKDDKKWISFGSKHIDFDDLGLFEHLFQFIKWKDEEPYNIDELLKGE